MRQQPFKKVALTVSPQCVGQCHEGNNAAARLQAARARVALALG
jgi:hypothetical protein